MPAYYDVHGGVLRHQNGYEKDLSPEEALIFSDSDEGREFRKRNPKATVVAMRSNKDYRKSLPFKLGKLTRKVTGGDDITGLGRIMESSPLAGAGIGTVGGAGLGFLGTLASNALLDTDISPVWGTLGGTVLGGGLGWLNSYLRRTANEPHISEVKNNPILYRSAYENEDPNGGAITKKAAMYQDPRNFILEKLQNDYTLDFSAKASLAAKVRTLSIPEAEKLAKLVRQAVGIGIGALVAKFVFGAGTFGTALGGLAGLAAYNVMSSMGYNPSPLNVIPKSNPYTYKSLL